MNREFQIAKILRPHGVKGTLKVSPTVGDIPFSKFSTVTVGEDREKMHIVRVQPLHQFYLVQLDGITSCEQAEFYRNQGIFADRDIYPELLDNVFLPSDYIGCNVIDENDNKVGIVVDVDNYGSKEVITINCGGVTYMIPFVEDIISFVPDKNIFVVNSKRFLETRV